jgi:hypothetical protein
MWALKPLEIRNTTKIIKLVGLGTNKPIIRQPMAITFQKMQPYSSILN